MEIVLALAAALLFALGTVLQQKAGLDEPEVAAGSSGGLLLRMAKRPVWLLGIASDALGFVGQAIALTIGRLAVVQPLLVFSVVFALPLGARFTGQRVRRADVIAALVVTAALAVFLIAADPSGGRDDAPIGQWLIAGGALGGVSALLVLAARTAHAAAKAALLGIATGLMFGLSAALTKAVGDQFAQGPLTIFSDWHTYALIVVGYASMTLSQLSLQTGVLAPAIATSMAFDPIASVILGVTLLQESLHTSALGAAAAIAALLAALGGLAVLARTQETGVATKPAQGTQSAALASETTSSS
ncbi:DMT family transporter [Conexibacter sp. JD483]|uniref:DMT family transporter n=1 Tax=unclassified Conexibacter TaxID=2627773 RepID=UPI002715F13C|nr:MULTISPECIES: DMT family transporter [unclassified Conexibacter]MDO8188461.1 DMT family transporter [Conexibacter sp. CPCC 205706]MDO8199178.1 DMT family transporter [Conexibacter sp. CPCC 205762]MDR9371931.1 DMT family transporter [Conexibacter sp. JD483]